MISQRSLDRVAECAEEGRALVTGGAIYGVAIDPDNVDHLLAMIAVMNRRIDSQSSTIHSIANIRIQSR